MMFGGKQHIPKSSITCHPYPLIAIQPGRIILFNRNRSIRPLRFTKRVYSKMNKHPVSALHHLLLSLIRKIGRNDLLPHSPLDKQKKKTKANNNISHHFIC